MPDGQTWPDVEWSVDPVELGTIDANGLLTVSAAVQGVTRGQVVARTRSEEGEETGSGQDLPDMGDVATVEFYVDPKLGEPGHLSYYVVIGPESMFGMPPGQDLQFQARLAAPEDQTIQAHTFRWSLDNSALGTIHPDTGFFRATEDQSGVSGRVVAEAIHEGQAFARGSTGVHVIEVEPWPEPGPNPDEP